MLVHDLANELLDCWVAQDQSEYARIRAAQREHYPRPAPDEEGKQAPGLAEEAERLARWQITMYERDCRVFGWRAAWVQSKKA